MQQRTMLTMVYLLSFASYSAIGQDTQLEIPRFKRDIDRWIAINGSYEQELMEVNQALSGLQEYQAPVSPEFKKSMEDNRVALSTIFMPQSKVYASTDRETKLAICSEVYQDLQVKTNFLKARPNAANPKVEVEVRTRSPSGEVSGCEVWYVPTAWRRNPERHRRFDRFSSPVSQTLNPGYYVMYTKLGDNTGKEETFKIGSTGQIKQDIDLVAP